MPNRVFLDDLYPDNPGVEPAPDVEVVGGGDGNIPNITTLQEPNDDDKMYFPAETVALALIQERAMERRRILDYIAANGAYNGAGDPGQAFYDQGLNPWLESLLADMDTQQ